MTICCQSSWVSPGDPGHVAHALAAQREVLGGGVRQAAGDEDGQQVRQVGRAGDGQVVLLRGQSYDARAGQAGQRLDSGRWRSPDDRSCGHHRPRAGRRRASRLAASGPDRSLPAIGWPPAYRSIPGTPSSARSGAVLTLPTSVTIASVSSSDRATSPPTWSGRDGDDDQPDRLPVVRGARRRGRSRSAGARGCGR